MIAPDKLWIGWGLITIAALGSVGLGFHHFGRRFSFIFVALGVLWFDYWYYSNVVNAPVVVQASHPVTSPIAAPSPAPSPTPSKPKLVSNIAKMILVCDSQASCCFEGSLGVTNCLTLFQTIGVICQIFCNIPKLRAVCMLFISSILY